MSSGCNTRTSGLKPWESSTHQHNTQNSMANYYGNKQIPVTLINNGNVNMQRKPQAISPFEKYVYKDE